MNPLTSVIHHVFPFHVNDVPSAMFDMNQNDLLTLYQFLITTDYRTTFVIPGMTNLSQPSNMYNVDMLNCVWPQEVFNIDINDTVLQQFLFLVQKNKHVDNATVIFNLCHKEKMVLLHCISHSANHIQVHKCEHCERQKLFCNKKRCVIPLLIENTWLLIVRDGKGSNWKEKDSVWLLYDPMDTDDSLSRVKSIMLGTAMSKKHDEWACVSGPTTTTSMDTGVYVLYVAYIWLMHQDPIATHMNHSSSPHIATMFRCFISHCLWKKHVPNIFDHDHQSFSNGDTFQPMDDNNVITRRTDNAQEKVMYKPFVRREIVLYKIGCGWWKFWNQITNKARFGNVNTNESSSTSPLVFSTSEACREKYNSFCNRDWTRLVFLRNEVSSSHVLRGGNVGKMYCSERNQKRWRLYSGVTQVCFLIVSKMVSENVLCFFDKDETTKISLLSTDICRLVEKHLMNVYVQQKRRECCIAILTTVLTLIMVSNTILIS